MSDFVISTDTASDLPIDYVKAKDIDYHQLFYSLDGVLYGKEQVLEEKEFYKLVREGHIPTTTATNPEDSRALFIERVKKGQGVIHIAFSSALSASCQNAELAKQMVLEEYPDAKITIIDSLSGSLGQGLLVYKAQELLESGKSYEEIVDWVMENRTHVGHQILVDDLMHLCRGGRISKSKATIGSIVGVKPLININDEGKLINVTKLRGQKKAFNYLIDCIENKQGRYKGQNDIVMIAHGDALDNAMQIGNAIKEKYGIEDIMYSYFSPTIGSHVGPGTVAVFYMQEEREKE